jgi:hypothetical protein
MTASAHKQGKPYLVAAALQQTALCPRARLSRAPAVAFPITPGGIGRVEEAEIELYNLNLLVVGSVLTPPFQ